MCIISERARSSGRCRDYPRWLKSPSSGAVLQCQRTQTAAKSPFSRSPVLSPELLPPAGHPSLVSTSSSGSGTTPSPDVVKQTHKGQNHYSSADIINDNNNNQETVVGDFAATFSKSLATTSSAAILCACTVPFATWHLPVFP